MSASNASCWNINMKNNRSWCTWTLELGTMSWWGGHLRCSAFRGCCFHRGAGSTTWNQNHYSVALHVFDLSYGSKPQKLYFEWSITIGTHKDINIYRLWPIEVADSVKIDWPIRNGLSIFQFLLGWKLVQGPLDKCQLFDLVEISVTNLLRQSTWPMTLPILHQTCGLQVFHCRAGLGMKPQNWYVYSSNHDINDSPKLWMMTILGDFGKYFSVRLCAPISIFTQN